MEELDGNVQELNGNKDPTNKKNVVEVKVTAGYTGGAGVVYCAVLSFPARPCNSTNSDSLLLSAGQN